VFGSAIQRFAAEGCVMKDMFSEIRRGPVFRLRGLSLPQSRRPDRLRDLEDFGSNPGALRARCYVPADLPPNAPLVVALHGCTQTAGDYDNGSGWSRLADQQGFAVLYPEQQRTNNPNLCFNWFAPEDIRRGSGEALSIRQMVETIVAREGLDRTRVFVTGLSAGGAMASVMLATYPEVFAGGGIIAGLAYGVATTIPEAFDRMRGLGMPSDTALRSLLRQASGNTGHWPRISVWQGTADHTVTPANAQAIVAQWQGVHGLDGATPEVTTVQGQSRRVWRDRRGRELIEEYSIAGMGHGVPLDTRGEQHYGETAPYMLETGISSTLQIARFWGIADAGALVADDVGADAALQPSDMENTPEIAPPAFTSMAGHATSSQSAKIRKVIEDALRTAGLMR
jgi:poly(hydroxyalkanoate) depolymerase family esterase